MTSPRNWAEVNEKHNTELIRTQAATIKTQASEIAQLRTLLQRWQTISPDLAIESERFPRVWIRSHRLNVLIENTIEALK